MSSKFILIVISEAKIDHVDFTRAAPNTHRDILGLEILMNYPPRMQVLQPLHKLNAEHKGGLPGELPSTKLRQINQ